MKRMPNKAADIGVLLYPLIIAIFCGAVLLDTVYSHLIDNVLDTAQAAVLFAEISDALLQLGALAVVAAIVAIALSWRLPAARIFFILSLAVLIAFEFLLPPILLSLLKQSQVMHALGPWLRILFNLVVVGLGFQALRLYFQSVYGAGGSATAEIISQDG